MGFGQARRTPITYRDAKAWLSALSTSTWATISRFDGTE